MNFSKNIIPITVRAAALLLVLSLAPACGGGPVSIGGRVLDDQGAAIAKAEVTTRPETDIVITNSKGFFILRQRITDSGETEPIGPGTYELLIRKFGFEDLTRSIKCEGGKLRVPDVVMNPRAPDIGESAPDVTEEVETDPGETSSPKIGI